MHRDTCKVYCVYRKKYHDTLLHHIVTTLATRLGNVTSQSVSGESNTFSSPNDDGSRRAPVSGRRLPRSRPRGGRRGCSGAD